MINPFSLAAFRQMSSIMIYITNILFFLNKMLINF